MESLIEKAAPKGPSPWADETFEAARLSIYQNAAQAFAQHELEVVGPFEWRCARPNTGAYSFRIIIRPSLVFVYGDIGHAIFRGGEARGTAEYTLGWLREALHSTGGERYHASYLCSKLKLREQALYPGDALDLCRERIEDGYRVEPWRRLLNDARRWHRDYGLDRQQWGDLVMRHIGDPEYCSVGVEDTAETLWVVEGLRWFCAHLPPSEEVAR